jgi:hypothetical protein
VLGEAVEGLGAGGLETEDEAGVGVEGPATLGVMEELELKVKGVAAAEVQLDVGRGVGVVTL